MPYRTEWVDPEVFLSHQGVTVFHVYKDDDADQRLMSWYAVETADGVLEEFDVRDLPGVRARDLGDVDAIARVIEQAIEAGRLGSWGVLLVGEEGADER